MLPTGKFCILYGPNFSLVSCSVWPSIKNEQTDKQIETQKVPNIVKVSYPCKTSSFHFVPQTYFAAKCKWPSWALKTCSRWRTGIALRISLDFKPYFLYPWRVARGHKRFYGVMVSTQDFESCDPSSSLGRTFKNTFSLFELEPMLTHRNMCFRTS